MLRLPFPIGDSSRQQPRKKPSGGSSLDGQDSSRADDGEAANGHGNSLQRLLSLRRVASTIAEGKQLTPSRGEDPHGNNRKNLLTFVFGLTLFKC